MMNFYLTSGQLCFNLNGYAVSGLHVKLQYHGEKYNVLDVESAAWTIAEDGKSAYSQTEQGNFTLYTAKKAGCVTLKAVFAAAKQFPTRRGYRLSIHGFLPVRPKSVVYNAAFVYGRVRNFEMGSSSSGMRLLKGQTETGSQYMAAEAEYKGRKGYYTVVGFTTFDRYFGEVSLCENGEFTAYSNLDDYMVQAGDVLKTDEVAIFIQRDNRDILSLYGKRIAKANKVKGRVKTPTGWCSWYYYGPNISEDIIRENMQKLKEERLPIDYIQIDDGWQKCYGDWVEKPTFSGGMKKLAEDIVAAGYTPGIWVAPWLFAADSQTFKDNPSWFVKDKNGNFHPNRLIDFSVKGAREWLYNLTKTLTVDWGYKYLKIDLVSWRLAIKDYKKRGFNAVKNFREGLKIMRSAAPKDTVFMTCTSPLGAAAGLADCARISWDIFERWESLKDVARLVFRRYYITEYLNTDPDCLMVRKEPQHDEQAFRVCVRDDREIKTFINFMSAAGGALMLSDKMTLLCGEDFEKIRTLFPISDIPAKPLDLFEREIPAVLYYGKRNGLEMYALFNWENREDTLTVNLGGEKYVHGYYGACDYGKHTEFSLTLAAHDSQIIYVAEDKSAFAKIGKSIMPEA